MPAHTDPATQLAKSITALAAAGAAEGRDYLRDLMRLLREHAPPRRPATLCEYAEIEYPGLNSVAFIIMFCHSIFRGRHVKSTQL
jgi:hypothetical protein